MNRKPDTDFSRRRLLGAGPLSPPLTTNEVVAPSSQAYTLCDTKPEVLTGVSGRVTLSSTNGARA